MVGLMDLPAYVQTSNKRVNFNIRFYANLVEFIQWRNRTFLNVLVYPDYTTRIRYSYKFSNDVELQTWMALSMTDYWITESEKSEFKIFFRSEDDMLLFKLYWG